MQPEQPAAEYSRGKAYPGKGVSDEGMEYVVEFAHAKHGNCYLKLAELDDVAHAMILRDQALNVHRRWAIQRADGEVLENMAVAKIMAFKAGGYELLVAELTGETFQ